MMAGTIWDSCTIQQQLVQELLEFYSSFLLSPSPLHTKDLDDSSSSLSSLTPHMPFWSVNYTTLLLTPDTTTTIIIIIIIVVSWDGSPILVIGPVIHERFLLPWATKRKRKIVHFVHASIMIGQETLMKILQSNISRTMTQKNNAREMVALPKCPSPTILSFTTIIIIMKRMSMIGFGYYCCKL
jgi:hypothetical protein